MLLGNYRLDKTVKDKNRIIGYIITDLIEGKSLMKDKAFIEQAAVGGYIINARGIENKDGTITLQGYNCKLRELPIIRIQPRGPIRHKVTGIITRNKKTIGYVLTDSNGKSMSVNLEEAVSMTRNGLIEDVSVQKYADSCIRLRGKNGFALDGVPKYKC